MLRRLLIPCLVLAASTADAVPLRLTDPERRELETLARRFYESTRDGARSPAEVFPSRDDLRALFTRAEPMPGPVRSAGVTNDAVVLRQLSAIDRDVQSLRARFAGGTFRGLAGAIATEHVLRQRTCGRYARTDAACADGLIFEYQVGAETRRFSIDTLVRVGRRWRVLDVRH